VSPEHTTGQQGEQGERLLAQQEQADLVRRAASDPLTGLANRSELRQRLAQHLGEGGGSAAVLYLDLDGFKQVNDSLGHAAGDELLVAVAGRLRQQVRTSDVVARLGGDEFVVALLDDDASTAERVGHEVAHRVLAALRDPVRARGRTVRVSASIGVAVADAHLGERGAHDGTAADPPPAARPQTGTGVVGRSSGDAVLADADAALYQRKAHGRDGVTWFDDALRDAVRARDRLEVDLRSATGQGQLSLDYQPVLDLGTGAVEEVEALLRWDHPQRGRLGAGEPVAVAERSGMIVDVGAWVLTAAVRDAADLWGHREPFTTWVNVSALQLVEQGFTDGLLHQLARAGLAPWRFGVEVTERALSAGGLVEQELVRLSASGIKVAVDDFGAGSSSLAQLSHFPVDVLKVDRSFTTAALSRRGQAVLSGLVTLGHAIGARVVGEGVETADQLRALQRAGCDAAQGHLLLRPGPPSGALARVLAHDERGRVTPRAGGGPAPR